MSEFIDISLKRAVIALAEELDYARAAEKLSITTGQLRDQVSAFETLLCLQVFEPRRKKVVLTADGQALISILRKSVAVHDRNASKGTDETSG